jgi:hypothetical protein
MAMKSRFLPQKLLLTGLDFCPQHLTLSKGRVLYFPSRLNPATCNCIISYGSSGLFRYPLALRMASRSDIFISEQFILKPSGVTMRLFSRIDCITLQTSKSWGAAAKRYASVTRVSLPVFFLGNTATTDESAPKTPMASSFFLTYQEPLTLFSMYGLSAIRDQNFKPNRPDGGYGDLGVMPNMLAAQGSLPRHSCSGRWIFHSGKTVGVNVSDNRPCYQAYGRLISGSHISTPYLRRLKKA